MEQKKIFQDHIDGLIKKGETKLGIKHINEDLVKESKAEIGPAYGSGGFNWTKSLVLKEADAEKLFPKIEARAIELLNEGLSAPGVKTTLEDEGIS